MGSYLDGAGLTQVWGKLKDKIDAAKEVKSLTKAEYDALEEKEQNVIYSVTDGEGDEASTSIWLNGEQLNGDAVTYNHEVSYWVNIPETSTPYVNVLYKSNDFTEANKLKINDFENNKITILDLTLYKGDKELFSHKIIAIVHKDDYLYSLPAIYNDTSLVFFPNMYFVNIQNVFENVTITIKDANIEGHSSLAYANLSPLFDSYGVLKTRALNWQGEFMSLSDNNSDLYYDIASIGNIIEYSTTDYSESHADIGSGYSILNIRLYDGTDYNEYKSANYLFAVTFDKTNLIVNQLAGYASEEYKDFLEIGFPTNKSNYVQLHLTKNAKHCRIEYSIIGSGKTIKGSSIAKNSNCIFVKPINGSKVYVNDKIVFTSEKNYTDVEQYYDERYTYTSINKSDNTFYILTDYSNVFTENIIDTGIMIDDTTRKYQFTLKEPIEFKVGDTIIVPELSGYDNDGNVYGNILIKVLEVKSPHIYGICITEHPEDFIENRIPQILKGMKVDIVNPPTEELTRTTNTEITNTNTISDYKINGISMPIYRVTFVYKEKYFKTGDIVIVPSIPGYADAKNQAGNLLLKVVESEYGPIKFYCLNQNLEEVEAGTAPNIPIGTELKLYSRI